MTLTFQHSDGTISTVKTFCEKLASDDVLKRLITRIVETETKCDNCGGTGKIFVGNLDDDLPCYMDCPACTHLETDDD